MYKAIANLLHEGRQFNMGELVSEKEIKDIPLHISKQIFEPATEKDIADAEENDEDEKPTKKVKVEK